MSNPIFYIKEDDLLPVLEAVLVDGNGDAVNLSGTTGAAFHMVTEGGSLVINRAITVVDASEGRVRVTWLNGETDTPGTYNAEFEITYSGGATQTFPNDRNIRVVITSALA